MDKLQASIIARQLDSESKIIRSKKEVLYSLLQKSKISKSIYDEMDNKLSNISSQITELKELLQEEELNEENGLRNQLEVLEQILYDLKFRQLIGEIREKDWEKRSAVLYHGIDSTRETISVAANHLAISTSTSSLKIEKTAPYLDAKEIKNLSKESVNENKKLETITNLSLRKTRRHQTERKSKIRKPSSRNSRNNGSRKSSKPRRNIGSGCQNPWRKRCSNRNIALSIYYKGQSTPICHQCWEELSTRNIEWTGP